MISKNKAQLVLNRIICRLFPITVLLLLGGSLYAQVAQTQRVEIELKEEYTGQKVYLFGKKGLILLSKSYEAAASEIRMKFEHFNTDLVKTSEKEVALDYMKGYNITFVDNDRLWIFFHHYRKGNFTIVEFDPVSGIIKRHTGNLIPKFDVDYFRVLNNQAYFAGTYKKRPMMARQNIGESVIDYPDLSDVPKYADIIKLKITDDSTQVHLLLSACRTKKDCEYILIPFDRSGASLAHSIKIRNEDDNKLGKCSTSGLKTGDYMAAGTYSNKSYSTAQGVYVTRFNESNREYIKFYNFLEFKNFLSYLSKRKKERIERKKERKSARGKELKLNYRMVIHDLIERENEFIFIGEVYYPTYRTESYTSVGPNGGSITRTRRVFDGFQYSHAAIAAFDDAGNMKWSNTFEMWLTYKPFSLKRFLTVAIKDDTISLMFATGSKIKSVAYINGIESDSRDVEIVKTGDEEDKLRWTTSSDVDHWYDNTYLADGFQKIVNKKKEFGKRRRKVYYLNKVEF